MSWYKESAEINPIEQGKDLKEIQGVIRAINKDLFYVFSDEYKNCPYKDLKEVQEAAIRGVIRDINFNPTYVFSHEFPYELLNFPEVQDIFEEKAMSKIIDKLDYNVYSFDNLYCKLKSTSFGQKLRRELIKPLFLKIRDYPNFYYGVIKYDLDPDLRNDFENIAKHLRLPIRKPERQS